MSNYKFHFTGSVEIPAYEMQWIRDCILKGTEYMEENNIDFTKDELLALESDALYDIFNEEFDELFLAVCRMCHINPYIRNKIYEDVKNTVFTMVQDEFEKRR